MALIPLSDLLTTVTQEQALESLLDLAEALKLPARSWRKGGIARTILVIMSYVVANVSQLVSIVTAGGFLDYARGKWLTLLAQTVFNVERQLATTANGTQRLINASVVEYTIEPGDLHFADETTGKTYTNTTGGTLAASSNLDIEIEADEPGSASSSGVGLITVMVTPLVGVTTTNLDQLTGLDEEEDEDLIQRCKDSRGALSPNGPQSAYDYIAKSTSVVVTRTKTVSDLDTGEVFVYITNPSGTPITGDLNDPDTDLGEVNLAIQTQCVPPGIKATPVSADAVSVPVTYSVKLYESANIAPADFDIAASAALAAHFANIPLGGAKIDNGATGYVLKEHISSVIRNCSVGVAGVSVSAPAADVALDPNEVATLGTVTPSPATAVVGDP